MNLNDFMNSSKTLARNPLGIIALFISLIYGFACLVLGTTAMKISANERILLIWFIIIFPTLVLITFLILVIKHHKKLYAPSDFQDERNFMEVADTRSYFDKINKEYLETNSTNKIKDNIQQNEDANKTTENQKNSNSIIANINTDNYSSFLNSYLSIQNLALNYIENIYKSNVTRNIRFKEIPDYPFDGVIINDDRIIGVEIKHITQDTISQSTIDNLIGVVSKFTTLNVVRNKIKRCDLIIFFVHELSNIDIFLKGVKELNDRLNSNYTEINTNIKHVHLKTLYEYANMLKNAKMADLNVQNRTEYIHIESNELELKSNKIHYDTRENFASLLDNIYLAYLKNKVPKGTYEKSWVLSRKSGGKILKKDKRDTRTLQQVGIFPKDTLLLELLK